MAATQDPGVLEKFEKWGLQTIKSQLPRETRHLRACIRCRLIMSKAQFFELGCPNCRSLEMQENENRVVACTTSNFSGFFSMVNPGAFASRFNGLEKRSPGCYALAVHGRLPDLDVGDDDYEPDIDDGPESELQGSAQFASGPASPSQRSDEDFDMMRFLASPSPAPERKGPASARSRHSGEVSPSPSPALKGSEAKRKRLRKAEVPSASPAFSASSDPKQAPVLKDDESAEFR
ncbi:unnamed protein product [Cladocopium goreaui]|uniref:Transcription elongation factor SPT4-like 2 n=1 Tax=Cladocopium goreaui TaxID=2562237 RepID=A0A9P1DK55_9DINO|nr:unnamed protein product [Cladocopium goreaui]CAI4011647.1 unnamed protein product [Cladocopium goreaui]